MIITNRVIDGNIVSDTVIGHLFFIQIFREDLDIQATDTINYCWTAASMTFLVTWKTYAFFCFNIHCFVAEIEVFIAGRSACSALTILFANFTL